MNTENENDAIDGQEPIVEADVIEVAEEPKEPREIRRFDDSMIKTARMLWAMRIFSSDQKIQDALGIEGSPVVGNWRHNAQPDGHDWWAFREQFGALEGSPVVWEPGVSELEVHQRFMDYAGRIAATAMAALEQPQLFDEAGNRVTHLYRYDAHGDPHKTKLAGLGPTTYREVSTGVKQASEIIKTSMEGLAEFQKLQDDRQNAYVKVLGDLVRKLKDGGVELTDDQRMVLMDAERAELGEELRAPGAGALRGGE